MVVTDEIKMRVRKSHEKIKIKHVNTWGDGQRFAQMVGISEQLVSKFVRNKNVTLQTADKLAAFFVSKNADWDIYFFKLMPQRYRRGFIHIALIEYDED